METVFIEATNVKTGGYNWGKFMVARFTAEEWLRRSAVDDGVVPLGAWLLSGRGWSRDNLLVVDLQTGEGAIFRPGGYVHADLNKHAIWVCPMYEPFLEWLYKQDLSDLQALPPLVEIDDATSAMRGYRRPGKGRSDDR